MEKKRNGSDTDTTSRKPAAARGVAEEAEDAADGSETPGASKPQNPTQDYKTKPARVIPEKAVIPDRPAGVLYRNDNARS